MPKYRVTLELEASSTTTIEVMGNTSDEGVANAIDAIRIGVQINPMKYLANRKVELEAVECEEIEGDE